MDGTLDAVKTGDFGFVLGTGTGTWQLMLVIALAMSAAVLSGGGVLLVNQAAVSAVLVATLPTPDLTISLHRFVDALIGGGVALAANALTPVDRRTIGHSRASDFIFLHRPRLL